MNGKLNCSLHADNAAFTKLRHLENRVSQVETNIDNVESQVTELDGTLQDALTGLEEKVETLTLNASVADVETLDAVTVISDKVNTIDITATAIDASVIDVESLRVDALQGTTIVNTEEVIATTGKFTETQTGTANNETTNTETLNVDGETHLKGITTVDGDIIFTKDTGLSKLEGNYLEIEASNVVIDNKNKNEYALLVPGIDGDALFGGSVAVQDTLVAKNLIVAEEAYFDKLHLNDTTVLDNPTLKNITEIDELTDKVLDIDRNGKLIRKFVSGGSEGTVANALIANETEYTYELLDKYKQVEGNNNCHVILSNTAEYIFNIAGTSNAYLKNSNGLMYEFEDSTRTGLFMQVLSIAHNNVFYVIVPTLDDEGENVLSAELRKINLYNMNVEYTIDVSEYFAMPITNLQRYITWIPSYNGNILSEDKPVLPIAGSTKYFDLVTGNLLTRTDTFSYSTRYYLSKTDTWYMLQVSADEWCTNNKYASIEDAALIDTPILEGDVYVFDAPVYCYDTDNILFYISRGYTFNFNYTGTMVYRDENNDKVFIEPENILFNGVSFETNIYNNKCYVVNEYVNKIPNILERVRIDKTQANFTDVPITAETIIIEDIETSTIEVGGMFFYEGEWYHKRMSTKAELLDFVKTNTENKNFKILFDGNISFSDADFPERISSADIVGTYQVYDSGDNSLQFNGSTIDLMYNAYNLLDVIEFYKFNTVVSFEGLQNMTCLHLNDCSFQLENPNNLGFGQYQPYVKCTRCNNVQVTSELMESPIQINLNNCTNVKVNSVPTSETVPTFNVTISDSDRCYVPLATEAENITFKQRGAGGNVVLNTNDYTQVQPTWD